MATSVIILCPNGRRQTVKVTPNTTILQIIEEACHKQNLKPEEYNLKHHKKILDTTMTIRFSGLPNNAMLELIEALVQRTETEVTVCVQTEDGKRVMGTFNPSVNLHAVLSNLCPAELQADNAVVIYMRQEIHAVDLHKVTLKSLGLTGGRAILRVIHRTVEELKTQANVSAPLPSKPVEEKPYIRQFQRLSPERYETYGTPMQVDPPEEQQPLPEPSKPVNKPDAERNVNLNKNAPDIVGVVKKEKRKQTEGLKTKNITFNNESRQPKHPHPQEDIVFLGDRNAMLFSLETAESVRSDDLPDDFFELSITDIKKIFRDIKTKRLEMEESPLMTANMRDLENSKKQLRQLHHYKKTVIRIHFPSRIVLQGVFNPVETVEDVKQFVKEYLENQNLNFYLFTAPPKCILESNSKLIEVDCVPGALLHFGCEEKHENYLKPEVMDKLISTSLASLEASKIRSELKRNVPKQQKDANLKDILADVNLGASTSDKQTVYEDYDKKPVQRSPPEKVPKWFKPSK